MQFADGSLAQVVVMVKVRVTVSSGHLNQSHRPAAIRCRSRDAARIVAAIGLGRARHGVVAPGRSC
jgi:hypothetical protein